MFGLGLDSVWFGLVWFRFGCLLQVSYIVVDEMVNCFYFVFIYLFFCVWIGLNVFKKLEELWSGMMWKVLRILNIRIYNDFWFTLFTGFDKFW